MDTRAVGWDDAQQAVAVRVAQLEVTDDEVILDGGVLREALRAYPCPRCDGWHLTSEPKR